MCGELTPEASGRVSRTVWPVFGHLASIVCGRPVSRFTPKTEVKQRKGVAESTVPVTRSGT